MQRLGGSPGANGKGPLGQRAPQGGGSSYQAGQANGFEGYRDREASVSSAGRPMKGAKGNPGRADIVQSQLHYGKEAPFNGKGKKASPPPGAAFLGKDGKGEQKGRGVHSEGRERVYSGTVEFEKDHTFINGSLLGEPVYVLKELLHQAKPSPAGAGDTVAFFVHYPTGQQPHASRVLRLSGQDTFAMQGTFTGTGSFGFLACPDVKEFFGKDVFVREEKAQQFQQGQVVRFNAVLNAQGLPHLEAFEVVDSLGAAEPKEGDWKRRRLDEHNGTEPTAAPPGSEVSKEEEDDILNFSFVAMVAANDIPLS